MLVVAAEDLVSNDGVEFIFRRSVIPVVTAKRKKIFCGRRELFCKDNQTIKTIGFIDSNQAKSRQKLEIQRSSVFSKLLVSEAVDEAVP